MRASESSRYVLRREVGYDAIDEVFPHDDRANRFPVRRVLAQQEADRLQGHFDDRRRVAHRPDFDQVLFLNRFDGCSPTTDQHEARAKEQDKKGERRILNDGTTSYARRGTHYNT